MKCTVIALLTALVLSGCASRNVTGGYDSGGILGEPLSVDMANVAIGMGSDEVQSDQMLIWTGSITLEVAGVADTQQQITARTKTAGGYVESSSQSNYGNRPSVTLTLRVPASKLQEVMGSIVNMGKVTSKRLASEDITERYIDTQARLATKIQLRDRLQALLEKAGDVKDILAIEKELTRLQGDIDSMTARLKSMKGKVDYASLTATLNAEKKEKILGPLGYVWEGATWCVKKLFVWEDESYVEPPVTVIEPVDDAPEPIVVPPHIEARIVYPGETLDDIARQYGVSVDTIRKLNHLSEGETVAPGRRLRIPSSE